MNLLISRLTERKIAGCPIIGTLAVLSAFFPIVLSAQEGEIVTLPLNKDYRVSATCRKTKNNDWQIIIDLITYQNKIAGSVTLTGAINGCESVVQEDFNGDGFPELSVTYGSEETSSQRVYFVDTNREKIFFGGAIPIGATRQKDGSYHHEIISYGSLISTVYVLDKKRYREKQSTQLVFDGEVCLDENGAIQRYGNCPNGVVATQANPICFERENRGRFKLVPLANCSIDRRKVIDLHN